MKKQEIFYLTEKNICRNKSKS